MSGCTRLLIGHSFDRTQGSTQYPGNQNNKKRKVEEMIHYLRATNKRGRGPCGDDERPVGMSRETNTGLTTNSSRKRATDLNLAQAAMNGKRFFVFYVFYRSLPG